MTGNLAADEGGMPTTINATLEAAVRRAPDQLYVDFAGKTYTYRQLHDEVERLALGLHALSVTQGDRVLGLMDNGPDALIAWYAANRLGAIFVPVNTAYKGDFLRHQVNDSGARVVICDAEFVSDVLALEADLSAVQHLLYSGSEVHHSARRISVEALDAHRLAAGDAPLVEVNGADLAMLIYTSGTTGMSKGCMVSHNYLCDVSRRYGDTIGRTREDLVWLPMPLFHITGISIAVQTMQLTASAAFMRKFSVTRLWPEVERTGASMIVLLGSMAMMVADAPETDEEERCKGQVRTLVGIPMTDALDAKWRERFGVTWCTGKIYGSTEVGQAVNTRFDDQVPNGCCGKANDTFDVRIVDENDVEVPRGTVGEIVVRPKKPNVMFSGYWNNPEATVKSWRNLWHHMGDNGRMDEAGHYFFVDRSKDVIRRRGENISSFEMEATFNAHPAIAEAAIHAVPSEVMEDDVKATLVLHPDGQISEAEVLEWARSRVPRFALPRYVEFRDELPKNASGRVLKFQLRDQGVTARTWDREAS